MAKILISLDDHLVRSAHLRAAEKGMSTPQFIANILRGERIRQQMRGVKRSRQDPNDDSGKQGR